MGNTSMCNNKSMKKCFKASYKNRVIKSLESSTFDFGCKAPTKSYKHKHMNSDLSISHSFQTLPETSQCINSINSSANLQSWPSCAYGALTYELNNKIYIGSGTVIGPQFVLTSASIVYQRAMELEIDRNLMRFEVVVAGSTYSYRVSEIYYSQEYSETEEDEIALLVLDRELGKYTGYYALRPASDAPVSGRFDSIVKLRDRVQDRKSSVEDVSVVQSSIKLNKIQPVQNTAQESRLMNGSSICYSEGVIYYLIGLYNKNPHFCSERYKQIYLNASNISKIHSWIKDFYMKYNIARSLDLSLFPYCTLDILSHQASLGNLKYLTALDLRGNSIGPKGAKLLAKIEFKHLNSLDLTGNELGSKGLKRLAKGKLSKITTLKLVDNDIGPMGIRKLVRGNLINIEYLDLADNRIGNDGAKELARGSLGKLTELNLKGNEIGPAGAKDLAIGKFGSLRCLNLAENKIGDKGALELAQGKLGWLNTLDLSYNQISYEVATGLREGKLSKVGNLHLEEMWAEDKAKRRRLEKAISKRHTTISSS